MHTENHLYGHSSILHEYCGYTDQWLWPIHGVLQHGWMSIPRDNEPLGRLPVAKFLWSERLGREAVAEGWEHVVPIGAAFLYLLSLPQPRLEAEPEGTIVYPWHGLPWAQTVGDHRRYVAEVLEAEDGPVTFCLHWHDYEQEALRRIYSPDGARVITNGPPIPQDLNRRGRINVDRSYLTRQLLELRRHKRVVSNRVTTAVLYGIAAGNEVGVYGPPMHNELDNLGYTWLKETFRDLHAIRADPGAARVVADRELGRDLLRTPEELREIVGWHKERGREVPAGVSRPAASGTAPEPVLVEVCAFADELIDDPDMLRAWAAEFTGDDPITLVIISGETSADSLAAQLLSAMAEAGLANTAEEATLELREGPVPPGLAAVYTRSPLRAAAAGLTRVSDSALDTVRGWVHGSVLPDPELTVGRTAVFSEPPNIISHRPGGELNIGEYCSIAPGVRFVLDDERGGDVIATAVRGGWGRFAAGAAGDPRTINIEHDVWIGAGATVLPGVTVGTGAVITAGTVVDTDVRPYAVVAGNPAREVERRFTDDECELLLSSQWWTLPEAAVKALFPELCSSEVSRFVEAVEHVRQTSAAR
jgi:acetyltransferase-like isoleucine patch superfamily enzyme